MTMFFYELNPISRRPLFNRLVRTRDEDKEIVQVTIDVVGECGLVKRISKTRVLRRRRFAKGQGGSRGSEG
jgi:hypothetical protein